MVLPTKNRHFRRVSSHLANRLEKSKPVTWGFAQLDIFTQTQPLPRAVHFVHIWPVGPIIFPPAAIGAIGTGGRGQDGRLRAHSPQLNAQPGLN